MRASVLTAALVVIAGGVAWGVSESAETGAQPPAPLFARVHLGAGAGGAAVPARFVGLSFEAHDLPQLAGDAAQGNLAGLLKSLGPGTLRFGGDTSDNDTAWVARGFARPPWARMTITATDLDRLARLARETGWNVLLGVSLGHYDPARAADEAAAASARLGPSLAGIEIGNEPDGYVIKRLRTRPWNYHAYRPEFDRYRRLMPPSLAIAGPDLSNANLVGWLSAFARDERPAPLTSHFYPLSHCRGDQVSTADLLSAETRAKEMRVLHRLMTVARDRGMELRLGETNNVVCHGQPGVSDTFAASLWAVDYLTRAMNAGVTGVNFHVLPTTCRTYSAICAWNHFEWATGRLQVQPEWYALLLASRLVGERPLAVRLSPRPPGVEAAAFRRPAGGVDLVLVNTSHNAESIAVPRWRRATLLRLAGRSLRSHAATLAGSVVAPDGGWHASRVANLSAGRRGIAFRLPPESAAVVSSPG